ncbi:MAG: NfeD family protein [Paludibacter sp.]|nr:NfeD family protein [Paludibacter sp.]
MNKIYTIFIFVIITTTISTVFASEKTIYKIDIKKEIGSTTWLYIQKGFEEAQTKKPDFILIHMNTYGGEVVYADSIRTKILNSKIPVYVFVDNNAASAGALIAIACDKIFMRPGGNIGAATVVNETGAQMPDKYQSYMRAKMRATAEAHGKDTIINGNDTTIRWKRDPLIAEAMVDDRTVIPGIIDSGKTLTFTAQEAIKYHYCEGLASSVEDVVQKNLNIDDYQIVSYSPSAWADIKGFLMSSVIQGILIMIIIGGIYFELQTPGLGFPSIAAITAAVLYFAPLYMDGLAANWEILIFVIGLILVALEVFVIPGFGIAGISGITLIIVGLTLSMLNNVDFNFEPVKRGDAGKALLTVMSGLFLGFGLIIYLSSKIGTKGIFGKMALKTTLENADGYIGVSMTEKKLVGKKGIAFTVLRLSGKVQIEGKVYDAVSEDGFIEKGTEVEVIRYETGQVYVVKNQNTTNS